MKPMLNETQKEQLEKFIADNEIKDIFHDNELNHILTSGYIFEIKSTVEYLRKNMLKKQQN